VGLKQLGQAARVVERVVHGVEQRQIAQLRTTVNVVLRKDVAAHHHCFRLTSGL
jgi:molybdenum cofactor biosynthesis enzyme MoaA